MGSVDILLPTLSSAALLGEAKLMKTGWFPTNQDSTAELFVSNTVHARGTDFPPHLGHS